MIAGRPSRFRFIAAGALALGAAACGDDRPIDPARTPASLSAQSPLTIDAAAATVVETGAAVLVRGGDGRPLPGIPVTFRVADGGGTIERTTARTNDRGVATSGRWTLGTAAGAQRLVARVARLDSLEFLASVQPGAPASVSAMGLAIAKGTVGTAMTIPPAVVVRDRYANPIPGVPVTFEVRTGGAFATGTETVTDAQGTARLRELRLGTRSGAQEIAVRVPGVPEATLTVNAVAGPADVLRLIAGSDQIARVGAALKIPPTVSVRDIYDNPVAGRTLSARVTEGGGALTGTVITGDDGTATIERWSMGFGEGLNALAVEVDGLSPLTIYAKAVPVSTFDIEFRYVSMVTTQQRAAFERGAERWKKVIIGDVPDINAARSSFCGVKNSALNEVVDDLVIFVELVEIDGPGEVLGSAGPCTVRSGSGIPIVGAMRFDLADVVDMEASGRFDDVVLHEIGHILGLGTLWKYHSLLAGEGSDDPYYLGASGRAGFLNAGGSLYTGLHVPVENTGEVGTREGHWRESVLNAEVMTGFVERPGVRMPLSLMTIGALEDLGYRITIWGDDAYTYHGSPLLSGALPRRPTVPDRELIEVPFPPPEVVTASGQSSPISAHVVRPLARERRVTRVGRRPVQQLEVRRQR